MTRDQYCNSLQGGVLNTWRCDDCKQLTEDIREHIPSSPSDNSFFSNLNAEISSTGGPSFMSESTNMDITITDDVNMSTSLITGDSSIAGDSTIDEAGTGSQKHLQNTTSFNCHHNVGLPRWLTVGDTPKQRRWQEATLLTQKDNAFKQGRNGHNHPWEPGTTAHHHIKAKAKTSATTDMFTSAAEMANNIVSEEQHNVPSLPSLHNLAHTIKRKWQQIWPKDPDTLDFNLAEGSLSESFFQADITVDGCCHIIFASNKMTQLLVKAKKWYIHATFKIIKHPFTEPFSTHAFIHSGDNIKQVPLMFAFTSGKRTVDYKEVLQAVKSYQPATAIQTITMDFEPAMWDAAWQIFPDVTLLACSFHWTQAVYHKIQKLGLAALYQNDHKTNDYLQKLMVLQYLPAEHITPVFEQFQAKASTLALQAMCEYIRTTWINIPTWPTASWSVFLWATWTNNDVEGWHRHINHHAKKINLPFYVLVKLLHEEADSIGITVHLLSENKLCQHQCKHYRSMQSCLFIIW